MRSLVGYGYPSLPAGYRYGAPPPLGYGYRALPVVQKPKNGKEKLGLGMGLLGGAFSRLLIRDMMVDAIEASYEAGFYDGDDF
ncbi:putative protein SRC2 [Cocos nucifera]|nr:putative protein SRC2 [Cocos nucifera]